MNSLMILFLLIVPCGTVAPAGPADALQKENAEAREAPDAAADTERDEQADAERDREMEELRRLVDELTRETRRLHDRIDDLEEQEDEAPAEEEDAAARLDRLREAAEARAGTAGTAGAPEGVDEETVFQSGTRMQSQMNPELSITGDVLGVVSDDTEEFVNREWELNFQADLDPFSRFRLTLAKPEDESVEIEEGYISWTNLPGLMGINFGRFRQQFGVLNRWHLHALDQVDYPLVLQESFGEEGLGGTGVHFEWSLPWLWADANELVVEVTNGDNEVAFAGDDFDDFAYVTRLKSYWDAGINGYFETGLNGAFGRADEDGKLNNNFYGLDWTYYWAPPGRSLYRSFTLRGLLVRSVREMDIGESLRAWGGYAYGEYKFNRRIIAGLRFDRADSQLNFGEHTWLYSPYLTFWQSEFVRMRAQYEYRDNNVLGIDRRLILQVTFAAGPHKHEAY